MKLTNYKFYFNQVEGLLSCDIWQMENFCFRSYEVHRKQYIWGEAPRDLANHLAGHVNAIIPMNGEAFE